MPTSQSRLLAGLPQSEPWKPHAALVILYQFASLAATAWIVWSLALPFQPRPLSLAGLIAQTAVDSLLALLCCSTFVTAFHWMTARSPVFGAFRMSLATARTAIWVAPTAILLSRLSIFAVGAAIALVTSTTHLLYCQRAQRETSNETPSFAAPPRLRASAYAVALGGQTTVVTAWMGAPMLAAALLCVSAASVTMLRLQVGAGRSRAPDKLSESLLRILVTLILAAGLTTSGRVFGWNLGPGGGGESDLQTHGSPLRSARALIRKLEESIRKQGAGTEFVEKGYQGVILWPPMKEVQKTLAAPRIQPWSTLPPVVSSTPSRIPFSGQYWMFKPPLVAPPQGSYVRRSSPLDLAFLTTDQRPMTMQAIQMLEHPLELACCSAIQISISNADRYPGTIALELLLVDAQSRGQPVQSLGRRDVVSRPEGAAVTELLEFPVPANSRIGKFDEIQVIFQRDFIRIDKSARISIEHFVLIPR
jgi:hypothetical protein